MVGQIYFIVILSFIGLNFAAPGEYVPKAYYYLDQFGHPSDMVYLRTRRSSELWPIFAKKLSSNFDSLDSAEHSPDDLEAREKRQTYDVANRGPLSFSRTGEAVGKGVRVVGVASGMNGAFSSSSSSIDSNGKIDYSVKTGKY